MCGFRIIPVIDILNSKAVHAIKGERTKYKPLISELFKSSDPIEIIKILNHRYNFDEIYLADLDAIIKKNPNYEIISKITKFQNLKLILDPGIVKSEDILKFSRFNIKKLILGLETINSFEVIRDSLKIFGIDKIVISVDMFKGKIITKIRDLMNESLLNTILKLKYLGVRELILLDLFRVGQKLGGVPPLYLKIREIFDGEILVGGGIKNFDDLQNYYRNSFSGVLLATALYDGSINIEKLNMLK
jgi:phosphoribosylformimino-5-aminoimidazole carboxamide ribotide isomerase